MNSKAEREREFHDKRYADDSERKRRVSKYYASTDKIRREYLRRLQQYSQLGGMVLEFGCGVGSHAAQLALSGSEQVIGIDISWVAVDLARRKTQHLAHADRLLFQQMNAETLAYRDNTFDLICGTGILHHLDIDVALRNLAKVLRQDGVALFIEPLGHNPLINLYRRLTPNMRSNDERPLHVSDLRLFHRYFGEVKIHYYGLFNLGAAFLFGRPGYDTTLALLTSLDSLLLCQPWLQPYAWQVLIELKHPIH